MTDDAPRDRGAPGTPSARDCAGTTLVETMLTLATVFIAALVLAGAGVTVHGQGRLNRDRARALDQMDALLEQMTAMPVAALPLHFPHDQVVPAFAGRGPGGFELRVRYVDGDTAARPLRYEVEGRWTGQQGRVSRIVVHGLRMR